MQTETQAKSVQKYLPNIINQLSNCVRCIEMLQLVHSQAGGAVL